MLKWEEAIINVLNKQRRE